MDGSRPGKISNRHGRPQQVHERYLESSVLDIGPPIPMDSARSAQAGWELDRGRGSSHSLRGGDAACVFGNQMCASPWRWTSHFEVVRPTRVS